MMTETITNAGSVYGFARQALGPFVGFVAGWMILLDYLLIPAYVYVVMAVALGSLMPQVDRAVWILLVAAITLGVNWFGIKVSQRFNLISVGIQFAILALLVIFSLIALHHGKGGGGLTLRPLYAPGLFDAKSLFAATAICVMTFLGFDAISTLAEEVTSDDKRTVGRAIVGRPVRGAVMGARRLDERIYAQGSGGGRLRSRRMGRRTLVVDHHCLGDGDRRRSCQRAADAGRRRARALRDGP
jgi:amino acid transporter